jgi:hypothetical protein
MIDSRFVAAVVVSLGLILLGGCGGGNGGGPAGSRLDALENAVVLREKKGWDAFSVNERLEWNRRIHELWVDLEKLAKPGQGMTASQRARYKKLLARMVKAK